ncbi:MAG: DUF4915 domain-containing protein, partial [Bacteroidota bacterium]
AKKTLRKLEAGRVTFIVDSSKNLQGTQFEGLDIFSPERVSSDYFVIICSTATSDISEVLQQKGLTPNQDFISSPILNDLLAISELEQIQTTFYFTSGTAAPPEATYGGGLYRCKVSATDVELEKCYAGPCYGALSVEDKIYFIDTDRGLIEYDGSNFILKTSFPEGSRAHGISYHEESGSFYVACSYLDAVLHVNPDFSLGKSFKLSQKHTRYGEPMHHCNDVLALGNSLYVSMFSSTGNWKNDSFDGCMAEFDLETEERLPDVYQGLYMPHNVKYFDGSLHILDSLPGHLRFNNFAVQGTFPAFTRGLDYKNGLYYVGQSKNRNYSKVMGLSNNISIDCGVILFNPELHVSRFIQFPYTIGEIHAIVVKS